MLAFQVGETEKELGGPNAANPFATLVDEAEGLDKIEDLQNHNNEDIYEKAVALLENYFDVEDGEVENLAPAVDAAQGEPCLTAPGRARVVGNGAQWTLLWRLGGRRACAFAPCWLYRECDWQET